MQQSRLGLTSPEGEQQERASASVIGEDRFSDASSRQLGDRGVCTLYTRISFNIHSFTLHRSTNGLGEQLRIHFQDLKIHNPAP
jgi:hypothetical protein